MKIESIKKSYKKNQILRDINLSVQDGMCIGLIGSNGSGKSTLLSILAGITKADNGKFVYDNTDLLSDNKKRSEFVGYVPQGTPLLEELSAKDNLSLWYSSARLKTELSCGVLKMLGIDEFINTPVYKMSGGMKKRLSIGCAVASNPKILLLDEPTAALDLICKDSIAKYLMEFKSKGNIILLATHDLQELNLCDKLYVLKNGVLHPADISQGVEKLVEML